MADTAPSSQTLYTLLNYLGLSQDADEISQELAAFEADPTKVEFFELQGCMSFEPSVAASNNFLAIAHKPYDFMSFRMDSTCNLDLTGGSFTLDLVAPSRLLNLPQYLSTSLMDQLCSRHQGEQHFLSIEELVKESISPMSIHGENVDGGDYCIFTFPRENLKNVLRDPLLLNVLQEFTSTLNKAGTRKIQETIKRLQKVQNLPQGHTATLDYLDVRNAPDTFITFEDLSSHKLYCLNLPSIPQTEVLHRLRATEPKLFECYGQLPATEYEFIERFTRLESIVPGIPTYALEETAAGLLKLTRITFPISEWEEIQGDYAGFGGPLSDHAQHLLGSSMGVDL